ncbi:hypothetical protein ACLB2K_037987 [Fragaria x ananassa]
MQGIFDFLEFVRLHSPPEKVIHICPCNKCLTRKPVTIEEMYSHLALYGICSSYTVWTWHGETQVQMPTTDQPNESYQEKSPHVVPDTEDIRVNNQHVPVIIGYMPVTPSEMNSRQRKPTHDDEFIDDSNMEKDQYSGQTEEDDDSDDSDYHEYD